MVYTKRNGSSLARSGPLGLVLILAILGLGCDVTAPPPVGAVPLKIPANYSLWWSATESCSGVTRPMSEIAWYSVPGVDFPAASGILQGLYRVGPDDIYMADRWITDGPRVRHEMLHALLDRSKGTLHPREFFLEKCAGVVRCNQACIETSDPAPPIPANTERVASSTFEISVEASRTAVVLATDGGLGYVLVAIRARNPRSNPVVVTQTVSGSFLFRASRAAGTIESEILPSEPQRLYFGPGETKVALFDLYAGQQLSPIGDWLIGGSFGGFWGPSLLLNVRP